MSKPSNVIEALARVSEQVGAIAKDRRPSAGPQYQYRGVEDVLNALHGPLIENGVVIVPATTAWEVIERPSYGKNGQHTETRLMVNYRIYGPGGPSDVIEASVYAAGIDDGDKGSGKAMSYAYKSLAFQLFCIPTDAAQDNEDAFPPERAPETFHGWNSQVAHDAWWDVQAARLKGLNDTARDVAVTALVGEGLFTADRRPIRPFKAEKRATVESIISDGEKMPVKVDHSRHALEVVAGALNTDAPAEADLESWMWDLAEVEDLDAHDWKITAKAAGWRQSDVMTRAQIVADELGTPAPERITEIHGDVAAELRTFIIAKRDVF